MATQRAIHRSLSLPVRLGFFSLTSKEDASLSINAESLGEDSHWWNDGLLHSSQRLANPLGSGWTSPEAVPVSHLVAVSTRAPAATILLINRESHTLDFANNDADWIAKKARNLPGLNVQSVVPSLTSCYDAWLGFLTQMYFHSALSPKTFVFVFLPL